MDNILQVKTIHYHKNKPKTTLDIKRTAQTNTTQDTNMRRLIKITPDIKKRLHNNTTLNIKKITCIKITLHITKKNKR